MLVVEAAVTGFSAYRDPASGTAFMQAFTDTLINGPQLEIRDLLNEVKNKMMQLSNEIQCIKAQAPQFSIIGRFLKFYFKG